jgi:hypothetical protein
VFWRWLREDLERVDLVVPHDFEDVGIMTMPDGGKVNLELLCESFH